MLLLDWASLLSGSVIPEAPMNNSCLSSGSNVCPLLLSEEQKKHLVAPMLSHPNPSNIQISNYPGSLASLSPLRHPPGPLRTKESSSPSGTAAENSRPISFCPQPHLEPLREARGDLRGRPAPPRGQTTEPSGDPALTGGP